MISLTGTFNFYFLSGMKYLIFNKYLLLVFNKYYMKYIIFLSIFHLDMAKIVEGCIPFLG